MTSPLVGLFALWQALAPTFPPCIPQGTQLICGEIVAPNEQILWLGSGITNAGAGSGGVYLIATLPTGVDVDGNGLILGGGPGTGKANLGGRVYIDYPLNSTVSGSTQNPLSSLPYKAEASIFVQYGPATVSTSMPGDLLTGPQRGIPTSTGLEARVFQVGMVMHCEAGGYFSAGPASTIRLQWQLAGSTVVDSGTQPVPQSTGSAPWEFNADISSSIFDVNGLVYGVGAFKSPLGIWGVPIPAGTPFNSTVAAPITLLAQPSNGSITMVNGFCEFKG